MLEYHAAYYRYPEDDGWYVVEVLDFPGVVSQGRTLKEARYMIRDALREMVAWYLEDGKPLPRPKARVPDKGAQRIEKIRVHFQVASGVPV
ncbi:MAG TPA: type II toxin-antitoxin system HicB family antitoxin [Gemmataceae bacterium]|nr:type II toxin-antitoxin system HicB family antitoxin [Gemmataceae bacterium]